MKGGKSFSELRAAFNEMDTDKSGDVNLNEFTAAVLELKLDITIIDIKRLFDAFDASNDGLISYPEFLDAFRGSMTVNRLRIVEEAFLSIDPQ